MQSPRRSNVSKGKKRKPVEEDEAEIEPSVASDDDEGVVELEPGEQRNDVAAPQVVLPKGKQRNEIGDIRFATAEKQAEYLSKQLTGKDGVAAMITAADILVLSSADRTQEGIWKALSSEVVELQVLGLGGKGNQKKKKSKQEGEDKKSEEAGAPKFVLLTSSSNDGDVLFKALSSSLSTAPIARAFQRRQKIESQIAFLKHPIAAIVGLPPRLHKLADIGSLSFTECVILTIDMTRNAKNFNFFDVKDIRDSFAALYHTYLASLVAVQKLRIVLY